MRLAEDGSFTSILLDKEKGTIVAICSSQTLFDKLTSLSDSNLETFEIKDVMNQCSLESFNKDINVLQSQEYSLKSSLNFISSTKSENSMENNNISSSKQKIVLPPNINQSGNIETFSNNNIHVHEKDDKILTDTNLPIEIIEKNSKNVSENEEFCDENFSKFKNSEKGIKTHEIKEEFSFVNLILKEERERHQKSRSLNSNSENDKNLSEKNSKNEMKILCEIKKDFSHVNAISNEEIVFKENEFSSDNFPDPEKKNNFTQFSIDKENIEPREVNSSIKFKEIQRIEDIKNSTLNEDVKYEKISSVKELKNKELKSNSSIKKDEISSFEKDSKKKKHLKTELTLNSLVDQNVGLEVNKVDLTESNNSKIENMKNLENINLNKRLESAKLKKTVSSIQSKEECLKKRLNNVVKTISAKSETILKEIEIMDNNQHKIISRVSVSSDSLSKLRILSMKIPNTKLRANSIEAVPRKYSLNLEVGGTSRKYENKPNSMMLMSKLNFIPLLVAVCDKKGSKKQMEITENKNLKKNSENCKNHCNLEKSENLKKIDNLFINKKRRNSQKCKSCGKRRKGNLNCPFKMEIFESESLNTNEQDLSSNETSIENNYSLPNVINYKDDKIQKFMTNTPNRLVQSLAVATLKLATKRTQNLHKNIVLCRQCLTPRYSESNLLKNLFTENKLDYSQINVTAKNSRAFKKVLKTFRNSSHRRENLSVNCYEKGNNISKLFLFFAVICFLIFWYLF